MSRREQDIWSIVSVTAIAAVLVIALVITLL
jgi:hypothetical protein